MPREEALSQLSKEPECSEDIIEEIKTRLNLTNEEFDKLLNLPNKKHTDYLTYHNTFKKMRPFFWILYKMDLIPKSFYIKYTT